MTANHYVLDVIVGGIVAMTGLAHREPCSSARATGARRRRPRTPSARGRRGRRIAADRAPRGQRPGPSARRRARGRGRHRGRSPSAARHGSSSGTSRPPARCRSTGTAGRSRRPGGASTASTTCSPRRSRRRCSCSTSRADDPAAARLLAATLSRAARLVPVLVSARAWPLLDEIDPALAQRIGSAARPRQLDQLIAYAAGRSLDGASLHLRLLDADRLGALRAHVPLVMTWPVNHRHEAERAARSASAG